VGPPERYFCPANCGKKPLETSPENYSFHVRWRGGGGRGEGKQVVRSSDSVLYAEQGTSKVYSDNVVCIYTWDVKRCGGPGWNTVHVKSLKCGSLKSLKCKCWRNDYLCVLLQIIYLDSLASPAELLYGELENVSFYGIAGDLCLKCVIVFSKQNE
jgi:hypothetical protein